MKVYSREAENYMIDLVTVPKQEEYEMRLVKFGTNEENPIILKRVKDDLYKIEEYDLFYKIKTNPLTYWGMTSNTFMFQVILVGEKELAKADEIFKRENFIITGFPYSEIEGN